MSQEEEQQQQQQQQQQEVQEEELAEREFKSASVEALELETQLGPAEEPPRSRQGTSSQQVQSKQLEQSDLSWPLNVEESQAVDKLQGSNSKRRSSSPRKQRRASTELPLASKRSKIIGATENANSTDTTNLVMNAKEQQVECQASAKEPLVCAGCLRPIKERYLLEALDKQWHEDCLKCAGCECRLGEVGSTLFTHDERIWCRRDFLRIYGQPGHCGICKAKIQPYEFVMKANKNVYHMECFACQQCQYRFCVGDGFYLAENLKVVCVICHAEAQHQYQQQQQQQQQQLQQQQQPQPQQQSLPASAAQGQP